MIRNVPSELTTATCDPSGENSKSITMVNKLYPMLCLLLFTCNAFVAYFPMWHRIVFCTLAWFGGMKSTRSNFRYLFNVSHVHTPLTDAQPKMPVVVDWMLDHRVLYPITTWHHHWMLPWRAPLILVPISKLSHLIHSSHPKNHHTMSQWSKHELVHHLLLCSVGYICC